MLSTIGSIAAGGALGAVMRHGANILTLRVLGDGFPSGTLAVNILGSFMMGVLMAVFAGMWNPSQEIRAFLTVGILGGFTTFSAFSMDTMALWTRGDLMHAMAYVLGSVILSIAALFFGSWLIWKFIV